MGFDSVNFVPVLKMLSRVKSVRELPSKILLVDGHCAGVRARCSVLEEVGHEATGVCSPAEALQLLEHTTFDVIITEYKLTGTTGPEFILKLREVAEGTPVILLSGFVDVLGLDERCTGADVVIIKNSLETSHLTHAVTRLLRRKPVVRKALKKPAASDMKVMRAAAQKNGTHE